MFPDMNGDNRTDYVVKGSTGSISVWLNIGIAGSEKYKLVPVGEVAGGQGNNDVVLADLDGDSRADYLMWDQDGGLSGYLNVRGSSEGQPNWISQGKDKSIAVGVGKDVSLESLRLADVNGDGKAVGHARVTRKLWLLIIHSFLRIIVSSTRRLEGSVSCTTEHRRIPASLVMGFFSLILPGLVEMTTFS